MKSKSWLSYKSHKSQLRQRGWACGFRSECLGTQPAHPCFFGRNDVLFWAKGFISTIRTMSFLSSAGGRVDRSGIQQIPFPLLHPLTPSNISYLTSNISPHFPIQNFPKIFPSTSSLVISPKT